MELEELKKSLKGKHIILDTNVLICLFENFDEGQEFISFLLLEIEDCTLTYFPLIEFEFTRGAYQKEHQEKRKEFLEKLSIESLPFHGDEFTDETIKIAQIYASKKKSPELVDCYIAAYLNKYKDKLFLATLNHKHFPQFIFDRIHVWPVINDKGDEPKSFPIGIYSFSKEKGKKYGLT